MSGRRTFAGFLGIPRPAPGQDVFHFPQNASNSALMSPFILLISSSTFQHPPSGSVFHGSSSRLDGQGKPQDNADHQDD